MAKANHSAEVKAQVLAALLAGQKVAEIADTFGVPEGTVKSWKQRARGRDGVASVAPGEKKRIGDLLMIYLERLIEVMTKQAEHTADKNWLEKQDAAGVAVLHGVLSDKLHRLIATLQNAESKSDPS